MTLEYPSFKSRETFNRHLSKKAFRLLQLKPARNSSPLITDRAVCISLIETERPVPCNQPYPFLQLGKMSMRLRHRTDRAMVLILWLSYTRYLQHFCTPLFRLPVGHG